MLKKPNPSGGDTFACEVAGCPKRASSNAALPRGWGKVKALDAVGELIACTDHRRQGRRAGICFPRKGREERARFIG